MPLLLRGAALLFCLSLVSTAWAQDAAPPPQAPAAATQSSGQQILQRKCAQCHAATMWTALRQDKRSWERTL